MHDKEARWPAGSRRARHAPCPVVPCCTRDLAIVVDLNAQGRRVRASQFEREPGIVRVTCGVGAAKLLLPRAVCRQLCGPWGYFGKQQARGGERHISPC